MTTPRFFTDPNGGIGYAFGARWPSADASEALAAFRKIDKALWRLALQNWYGPITVASTSTVKAAYDAKLGYWAIAYLTGGATTIRLHTPSFAQTRTPGTVPTEAHNVLSAASSGSGKIIFGMNPSGSTAAKIFESADGDTWTARNIGSANTKSVPYIVWGSSHGLFVALVTTGEAYTSPDGITWTSRTVPASLSGATWRGLTVSKDGIVVAHANATTTYMTSSDGGITWTERTGGPANPNSNAPGGHGGSLGYSAAIDRFVWNGMYVSSDGATWSAVATSPSNVTASTESCVFGVGPTLCAITSNIGGAGGNSEAEFSYDEANPSIWTRGNRFPVTDVLNGIAVSENQILASFTSGSDCELFWSLSLGA